LRSNRYGGIVIDWPHDILALAVAHALDFRLGRRDMTRITDASALLASPAPQHRGGRTVAVLWPIAVGHRR